MAQAQTFTVKLRTIMSHPMFNRGFEDARAGRGFDPNYDRMDSRQQWNYERGRMFYFGSNLRSFRKGRGASQQAVKIYSNLRREKAII